LQSVPIPIINPNLFFINPFSYLLILSIYCVGTDCKSALSLTNENFRYPSDRVCNPCRFQLSNPDGANIPKKRLRKIARICNPCPFQLSILIYFLSILFLIFSFCLYTVWARIANPRYRSRTKILDIRAIGFVR
jgi:hypothetical protein